MLRSLATRSSRHCFMLQCSFRYPKKKWRCSERGKQFKSLTLAFSSALMRTNSFLLWDPAMSRPPVFMMPFSTPKEHDRAIFSSETLLTHPDNGSWLLSSHYIIDSEHAVERPNRLKWVLGLGLYILLIQHFFKPKKRKKEDEDTFSETAIDWFHNKQPTKKLWIPLIVHCF